MQKTAKREYNKVYFANHREQMSKNNREYAKNHPEQRREYGRKYYANHPEQCKKSAREYKKNHQEQYTNYRKEYEKKYNDLKKFLFGDSCRICKKVSKSHMALHEIHGRPHKTIKGLKQLKLINPKDFILLCIRCHISIHEFMKNYDVAIELIKMLVEGNIENMRLRDGKEGDR